MTYKFLSAVMTHHLNMYSTAVCNAVYGKDHGVMWCVYLTLSLEYIYTLSVTGVYKMQVYLCTVYYMFNTQIICVFCISAWEMCIHILWQIMNYLASVTGFNYNIIIQL